MDELERICDSLALMNCVLEQGIVSLYDIAVEKILQLERLSDEEIRATYKNGRTRVLNVRSDQLTITLRLEVKEK